MTVRSERSQGLGRGLASLIPQRSAGQPGTLEIPTSRIKPNPHQPRKRFDPDSLATLTASIAEHGVLQPILVTETIDGYQLVAGERRLRAAQPLHPELQGRCRAGRSFSMILPSSMYVISSSPISLLTATHSTVRP